VRPLRRTIAVALALALAMGLGLAAAAIPSGVAAARPAGEPECLNWVMQPDPVTRELRRVCTQWSQPPGIPVEPDPDPEDEGDGSDCWWELYPIPEGVVPDRPAGVSDQAVMYWELCLNDLGNEYVGPGGAQWFEPDAAPTPSPAQVATMLRVEVVAQLYDPVVATDPPVAGPSIVGVPTFLAVTNWQGEVSEQGCDPTGTICVTITATPTLSFDPGEPGAAVVACEPGGTRFDEGGPPPDIQAAVAGACAHAYSRRTGVDGRPDAWTASATITWDAGWSGAGDSGTFTDISATTSFGRQVEELRTVVVDVS
jgi:hypothetical protein